MVPKTQVMQKSGLFSASGVTLFALDPIVLSVQHAGVYKVALHNLCGVWASFVYIYSFWTLARLIESKLCCTSW